MIRIWGGPRWGLNNDKAKEMSIRALQPGESKIPRKEWIFIIAALCNRKDQTTSNLNWHNIETLAYEEGVAGILYKTLKNSSIPRSALASFRDYYLSIAAQNIISKNALERLEDTLQGAQIGVMTLKGASLLDNTYPDIGMRPMGDLDLMVRPEQREGFINLLHNLGYKQDLSFPHIFHNKRVTIDLHIHALNTDRITNRSGLFPSGMTPIWDSSIPWREGFKKIRRPDDRDNILILSQHCRKLSFSRLIGLVDIYEMLRDRDRYFIDSLFKRANQISQTRSLSYILYLLYGLFDLQPAGRLVSDDTSLRLNRIERGILDLRIDWQDIERTGPLLSIFCIRGATRRIKFLYETVFPKKRVFEEEFIGSFHHGRLLFYPLRLLEGIISVSVRLPLLIRAIIRGH